MPGVKINILQRRDFLRYSDFINETMLDKTGINWNYYGVPIATKNVITATESLKFIHQYFEVGEKGLPLVLDPMEASFFIHTCFRAGCKENVLSWTPNFKKNTALPDDRAIHTVSGFFLGLLIENCLNGDRFLALERPLWLPFSYLWFLTFLYHDYGYCVTEKENAPIQAPSHAPIPSVMCPRRISGAQRSEYVELCRVKRRLGINLSLFSPCWRLERSIYRPNINKPVSKKQEWLCDLTRLSFNMFKCPGLRFNSGAEIHKHRYTSTTTIRYFNYCINTFGKIDHGIIGGFLFYDRMVKNYISAYAAQNEDFPYFDEQSSLSDFYYHKRHFSVEQLPVFLYIAGCIAAHNIWRQEDERRAEYEDHLLNVLFTENYKSITFEENPLLYILVIADTLEPTKLYKGVPVKQVSNAICVEYTPGSHKISFSTNSKNVPIEPLYKSAKGLESWTSVKCSLLNGNGFNVFI